jgi:hypothetical protein
MVGRNQRCNMLVRTELAGVVVVEEFLGGSELAVFISVKWKILPTN